ncbi:hypothetical protein ACQKWADRAFT_245732 [Trichoderma austrokoningii]
MAYQPAWTDDEDLIHIAPVNTNCCLVTMSSISRCGSSCSGSSGVRDSNPHTRPDQETDSNPASHSCGARMAAQRVHTAAGCMHEKRFCPRFSIIQLSCVALPQIACSVDAHEAVVVHVRDMQTASVMLQFDSANSSHRQNTTADSAQFFSLTTFFFFLFSKGAVFPHHQPTLPGWKLCVCVTRALRPLLGLSGVHLSSF